MGVISDDAYLKSKIMSCTLFTDVFDIDVGLIICTYWLTSGNWSVFSSDMHCSRT